MALTLQPSHFYTLYSPSKCELRLYYDHKGKVPSPPSAFQEIIFKLGQRHEKNHLSSFPSFSDLTGKSTEQTIEELRKEIPVIYQGELKTSVEINNHSIEIVGIPDFIIKDETGYLIRDCKLSRHTTEDRHPEIQRQLQLYGYLLEKAAGTIPLRLEVLKGDSEIDMFDYLGEENVVSELSMLLDIATLSDEPYSPVGWSKCNGCGYYDKCMPRAFEANDVALIYDVDQNLARRLKEMGIESYKELLQNLNEKSLEDLKRPWGKREQKVGKKAKNILL